MEVSFHPERVKAGGGWREVGETSLFLMQEGLTQTWVGRALCPLAQDGLGREIHKLDVGSELKESKSFLFLLSFLRFMHSR